ncbi:MAG TPA: ATP-binding protein, partial [Thermomicrobiales bacterium]|nr:ATP-binding protein [Thermomicrobiales bacterium]
MSDRSRLAFERVEIRRMPGIEAGFAVDGLCPGINVICGPNASGKTSLTRAVATLLWPRSTGASRSILHGTYALDGRSWKVEFDSGSARWQSDGQDADAPAIDAADGNDRYLLALHDLLRADNRDFAEAILRESTGGYDVGGAATALGYSPRPSSPIALKQRLDAAHAGEREARQAQEALRQQERERDELLGRQEQARAAGHRAQAIERALAVHRAQATLDEATRTLVAFPPVLFRLSGTEPEELKRLRQRQMEASQAVEQEQLGIVDARERQLATGLTTPLPPAAIAGLRDRFATLQNDSRELRAAGERRTEAEAVVAAAREAIGPALIDDQIAALDPVQFNALAGLMQQSRDAHAKLEALSQIADWIPPLPQDTDQDDARDRLAIGARCLTRWLREGSEPAIAGNRAALPLLIAAGVAVIESVLLGVLVHPALFVLLLVTVAFLVFGLRQQSAPERDGAADWRAEYQRLGLPAPAAWTSDAVETLIEELLRRARRIQADQEARQRWQYVRDERPVAVQHAAEVERQVAAWCVRFSVSCVRDVAALHTLANAISSWQDARGRAASAAALQRDAQARCDAALASINTTLLPFGYPAADGPAGVGSAIDDLTDRDRLWADAVADEQRAQRRLADRIEPLQQRCREELQAFFERLGLSDDDEPGLQALLDRLPDYREAALAVERAGLEQEHAQAALGDAVALVAHSPASLAAELEEAHTQHATLDDI